MMRPFKRKPLPAAEELALIQRVKQGDKAAMEILYLQHLGLIHLQAQRLRRMDYRARMLPLEDLVALGYEGFRKAVMDFDPAFGTRLSSYSSHWIRSTMQRKMPAYGSLVYYPESFMKIVHRLGWLVKKRREAGDESSVESIAAEEGLTFQYGPIEHQAIRSGVSLHEPVSTDSKQTLMETLAADQESVDETVLQALDYERVQRAMRLLPQRSQFILHCRFFLEMTLEATGALVERTFGHPLSREGVRLIENKSIKKIRAYIFKKS